MYPEFAHHGYCTVAKVRSVKCSILNMFSLLLPLLYQLHQLSENVLPVATLMLCKRSNSKSWYLFHLRLKLLVFGFATYGLWATISIVSYWAYCYCPQIDQSEFFYKHEKFESHISALSNYFITILHSIKKKLCF